MDDYIKVEVSTYDDGLIALLTLLPFDSFQEVDGKMICYIKKEAFTLEVENDMQFYIDKYKASFKKEVVLPQNWNKKWESSFLPVEVGDFCRIRADFHTYKQGYNHEIVVTPKMAFGTGHHETTYMMISEMEEIDFMGKSVFDFGCGTGILAILASKLGADCIKAVDIELQAYESTLENCKVNAVENVVAVQGDVSVVKNDRYDVILANVNRNVLVADSSALVNALKTDAIIVLSGILEQDKKMVEEVYTGLGLRLDRTNKKGKWMCMKFIKE